MSTVPSQRSAGDISPRTECATPLMDAITGSHGSIGEYRSTKEQECKRAQRLRWLPGSPSMSALYVGLAGASVGWVTIAGS